MGEQHDTGQLPPGRHSLPRDYVAGNQRSRILSAVARSVADRGIADTTVETVIAGAGISRKTFYQHFKNKEDVFLAAYDAFAARLLESIKGAQPADTGFVGQVESSLRAVLGLLAEHPAEARLVVVEVHAAGAKAIERRNAARAVIIDVLNRTTCALAEENETQPPPVITAETVVGGLVEVIHNRVQRGEVALLPGLLPDMMYCALLPYIGPAQAAAEHHRLTHGEESDTD